ncbi:MAG: transglutaminase-like domain-containing protein [Bacteroidota bacterium]
MKVKLFAAIMMAVSVGVANGQGSDIYKSLNQKFPGEPAVYVERSEVLNLVLDGDSIKAWADLTQDMLHLKDQTEMYSDKKIYGSSFTEIADIKAKTLVWDRSRYKEMSVTSFKKNDSHSEGIFYDDSYYYSFDFPSVASQSRTLLQYRENIKDIKFISGYLMQSNLPHALSQYTIKASKGIELSYKVLNDRENKITFQKTEKGGFVYYQWTAKDLPAIEFESNAPALTYFAPYVECHVKSYTTKKGTTRVLSDLTDLHKWYSGFIKSLNSTPSPELEGVVKDIKANSKTEMDIVKGVFYWVQDNIKYIAFEQGMRGLIPHPASYVCEKRYGDCKDMANLIVTMLHMAGVNNAYHTWIGTRDLSFKYTEFPTPIVDNHMIATYVSPTGEYIFLDGTGNYTKVGLPSSMIQGKEAFISYGPDKYEVKVVPEINTDENVSLDSVKLKIDNNKLSGSGKLSLTGYCKIFNAYDIDRGNQDNVRKGVENYTKKGSNKYSLKSFEVVDLGDRDKPTAIKYDFTISDYFQVVDNEIYVNLSLTKDRRNLQLPATRMAPFERDYKGIAEEVVEFEVPENYTVEYLPKNVSFKSDAFTCSITYTTQPGKIICKRIMRLDDFLLEPTQFKDWNDANKTAQDADKETIVLKKK